jgi:hypothetical protein
VGGQNYLGLDRNGQFVLTGMAYQVLPINSTNKITSVDVDKTYENLMTKFKYGNVASPKVYSDETVRRMVTSHRMSFMRLTEALIVSNDTTRACDVIDKHFEVFPPQTTGYDNIVFMLGSDYYRIGNIEKGNKYVDDFLKQNSQYLRWGFSLNHNQRNSIMPDLQNCFALLQQGLQTFMQYEQKELLDKYMPDYQRYATHFQVKE